MNPTQQRAERHARWLRRSEKARAAATFQQRRDLFMWEWVHGSGRKTSVMMKRAAIKEFGLKGVPFSRISWKPWRDAELSKAGEDLRRIWEDTQKHFKRKGVKTITLYRGIQGPVTHRSAITSWTTNRATAAKFGTYDVIAEEVPVERILAAHNAPGFVEGIFGAQQEFMVLF